MSSIHRAVQGSRLIILNLDAWIGALRSLQGAKDTAIIPKKRNGLWFGCSNRNPHLNRKRNRGYLNRYEKWYNTHLLITGMKKLKNLIGILCILYILAGCGGGSTNGENPPTVDTPHQTLTLKNEIMPVPTGYTDGRDHIGIGPAFEGESPDFADLGQTSEYSSNMLFVRYGNWNDPRGRDGSATATEMVRYLRSFQEQENKEAQDEGRESGTLRYSASDIKDRTIRLDQSTTDQERQAVARVVREINAALPWEFRLVLGTDIAQPFERDGVPKGEIHIRFTNGKSSTSWPDLDEDNQGYILGVGGLNAMRGGFVLIDTDATETSDPSSAFLQFVLTHELLHAMGIVAHADPDQYPNSVLAPTSANWQNKRPIYTTLDGEALLVNVPPGTRVADLATTDLGPWDSTGFHLVGVLDLDGNQEIQFGAGFRNGLGKPWAYGPTPGTTIQDNPSLTDNLRATWSGYLLGFSAKGNTIAGKSEIAIDLKSLSGEVHFNDLEYWGIKSAPGRPGTGTLWQDGDLGYTLAIVREGTIEGFVSTSALGDDPGVVSGAFVGRAHEGTAGVVKHPDLSAGFGAKR